MLAEPVDPHLGDVEEGGQVGVVEGGLVQGVGEEGGEGGVVRPLPLLPFRKLPPLNGGRRVGRPSSLN